MRYRGSACEARCGADAGATEVLGTTEAWRGPNTGATTEMRRCADMNAAAAEMCTAPKVSTANAADVAAASSSASSRCRESSSHYDGRQDQNATDFQL